MKTSRLIKTLPLATLLIVLAPIAIAAHAQTDAMPPETQAPAQQNSAHPSSAQQGGMGMHETEKAPVPPSKSLNLSFEGKSIVLSLTDLANMPQTTVHVHNAHTDKDETYSGPLLSEVLAKIGLRASAETHSLILHSTIVATGSDHYYVLYSGAEVEPEFSTGKVIVAVMKYELPDTEGGLIQLINTTDAKPARWVHGLSSISVMTLTPSSN